MNLKLKKSFLILIAICSIFAIIFFYNNTQDTEFNTEDIIGNTAGNLYNNGLFCEQNGRIYFSNMKDDGSLYSMDTECTNMVKIYSDKVKYINGDSHYLYYSRVNNTKENRPQSTLSFNNYGLYRINPDGSNIKLLEKEASGMLSIFKNTVHYQRYTPRTGLQLYSVQIDRKNNKKLTEDALLPASYYNGMMYYSGVSGDHDIHSLSMDTYVPQTIYSGNTFMPIATKDGIYFISVEDNYSLCRIDLNGENKTILVDEWVSTYNISLDGNTLYYQIDGGDNNRISKLDLLSMTEETIRDGNYKEIHVTSNYMFFRDFNEANIYAYRMTSGNLSTFHPPVLTK